MNITIWSTLLLFGSFHALFLVIVLFFQSHGNKTARNLLVLLLLIFSVILFDHSLRLSELYKTFPFGLYISDALWYLVGPLVWMYITTRVGNGKLKLIEGFHIIPFLSFLYIYRRLPFASAELKTNILETYLAGNSTHPLIIKVFILIMMIQILGYLAFSISKLNRYERKFKASASSNAIDQLGWLKQMIFLFTSYFLFEFTFSTYRNFANIQNKFVENWSLVMWCIFILLLTYSMIKNPKNVFETIKYFKPKYEDENKIELSKKLLAFVTKELPFRNGELSLTELADHIGITPHQLSYLLNTYIGTSFYNFINTYRARDVAKRFDEGAHKRLSIFGVAQASGFKSKASFYSFFKKEFQQTPKEYIKAKNLG